MTASPGVPVPGAPVRTDAEVLARVAGLIAVEDRMLPSLWLLFLDREQRQLPVLVPFEGIPDEPDPEDTRRLRWIISQVLGDTAPEGSAVITLTRPGACQPEAADLAWRDALREAVVAEGAPVRMMCLATPAGVAELPR